MKKILFFLTALLLTACTSSGSLSTKSTPSPDLDYQEAIQSISISDLQEACNKYLKPLGNPLFSATLLEIDNTQNPGTVQAYIYPMYQVSGLVNTTVQFGSTPNYSTVYKTFGNKIYLLTHAKRANATNSVLKQNNGVIGYLAQFEVSFNLKGEHQKTKLISCTPIE